jgi:hypothetical protein
MSRHRKIVYHDNGGLVRCSTPSNKIDPLQLSGLAQAIYVLKALEAGVPENEIIEQFEGDEQLVQIWISFLFHNRWMEHPNGKWQASNKGKEWIKRFPK